MPTRYIKPGICDSKHIDMLSAEAERLWTRLLVNVDDFGRLDARLPIIKAKCFPLKTISDKELTKWLKELTSSKLAIVYECNGDPYLQLLRWDNKPRATDSRHPPFSDACIQLYTDACTLHTNLPLTVTVTETKTETHNALSRFDDFWSLYPKGHKSSKTEAKKKWTAKSLDKKADTILADVSKRIQLDTKWRDGFIPDAVVYINQERWTGDIATDSTKSRTEGRYNGREL